MSPADINGVLQLLRTPGVQQFDGLARSSELRLRVRQCAELRAVFDSIATQDDAGLGKHPGAGVPDRIYRPADKGKAAVDVVILLPEPARLPGNFVSGVIGGTVNGHFQ